MKKKSIIMGVLALLPFAAQANLETVFEEDFENPDSLKIIDAAKFEAETVSTEYREAAR